MSAHWRKRILLVVSLLVLVPAGVLWGVYRHRQQVALEQAEAEWETRYAQEIAEAEARYTENQEALQVVVEAFRQNERLEMIHRNDPDEYPTMDGDGYYYWKNLQGINPKLYQALVTLEESGPDWEYWKRGCPYFDEDAGVIECKFYTKQYRRYHAAEISLFFSESVLEPPVSEFLDYWIQLDEHCWLEASEYPLPG